ncbi:MAG: tyrosine-type recombinase/integrase [Candidatus Acidiferrales bacterium]
MSRRSGQNGYIEKSGKWYVVRWRMDVEGEEKRRYLREKICPISGPGKLSASERERKAKDIVERSGANSKERFNRVVIGETTFRKQAEVYLQWAVTRSREPIKDATSVRAAFNKWILPAIGDVPLGRVNNVTVKPMIDKMKSSKSLSARTINKYVEYVKQVMASLKDGETGEPIHRRKWDSTVMDLPVVNQKEQRRPSLKASAISQLVKESEGEEEALYVLLAATGMRISEALALESKHFTNDGRTIQVRQQVDRDTPRIVWCLKTDAAYRDIDLHPDVAEFLQRFIGERKGLLFVTRNGTPRLHNNIEQRWLSERLRKKGLDEPGMGWHAFRRFRKTWLRGKRCQEDINIFWMGHKPKTMSELYSHLFEEVEVRLAEAETVGFGFDLPEKPSEKAVIAPNAPRCGNEVLEEVAVNA